MATTREAFCCRA